MHDPGFGAALAFARDLIRIPGAPGAEGDVAARVQKEMETLGYDDVWTDGAGNVIGRIRGAGDGASVLVNAHLDVVDIGEPDAWEHPPFGGTVADGFLHGRGAMDIKGPLAIQTHAAAALLEDRPNGDVFVAHTVLEERGGWGMEFLMMGGDVKPAAVIIGEATAGDICIGHRGRAEIIVEIEGTAGHASAPERADNPIALLPRLLPALDHFANGLDTHPILGPSTCALTEIETLPRSRNVIPDRVRIVIDWRVLPGLTHEAAVTSVRDAIRAALPDPSPYSVHVRFAQEAQHTYTGLGRDRLMFTPGFLVEPDHPVVRAAVESIAAQTGRTPRARPWTFATDGGHTCGVHGIPTIGYAPGEERYAHTNRERLALADAERAFAAYPHLIRAVAAAA